MKKSGDYQVYDLYECFGVVGVYDTLEEAEKAARDWEAKTDGKCDLVIRKWDETLCAYKAVPADWEDTLKLMTERITEHNQQ